MSDPDRYAICVYPNPILRKIAKSVLFLNETEELKVVLAAMKKTMYHEKGIGLAAPQVGLSIRLIMLDPTGERQHPPIVIFNPFLDRAWGKAEDFEGCLSLPGIKAKIRRKECVVVSGLDEEGKPFQIEAEGLLSRAIQHEMDHLDGKLLIDRIGSAQRIALRKQLESLEKEWKTRQRLIEEGHERLVR